MEPFQEENIEDVTISRYFAILQVNTVHLTKGGGRGGGGPTLACTFYLVLL